MARRSIANLSVSLTARTKGLRRGLKRARKSLDGFKQDALNIKTALLGALGGIGVGLALRQQADSIDNIAKISARLNIPINKLVALRHAAQKTGGDVRGLETGLQRMTRRIGEAAKGGGPAAQALKDIGLNASELSKLDAGKQLEAIVTAMNGITNQSEFIAVTQKIFDSEGVKAFSNLIRGGIPLIRQSEREVKQFGLTMSKVQAGRIEKINDNFFDLKQSMNGVNRSILNIISGPLLRLSEQLLGVARSGESMDERVARALAKIVYWVGEAADKLEYLRAGLVAIKTGILGVAGGLTTYLGKSTEDLQNLINIMLPKSVDFSGVFDSMKAQGDETFSGWLGAKIEEFQNGFNSMLPQNVDFSGISGPMQAIGDAFTEEAGKAFDNLNNSIERIQTGANSRALLQGVKDQFGGPVPAQQEPVVEELRAGNKLIQLQTDALMQVLRNPPATPATAG